MNTDSSGILMGMYVGTATHTTLLARLADGQDAVAWNEFVTRYGDLIRSFCLRRGLQAADSDDVQQEVLLSLSKAMPEFRYDPSKGLFRSYLKTVVSNAISRKMRQNPSMGRLSQVEHLGSQASEQGASAGGGGGIGGGHGTLGSGSVGAEDEHWEVEWRRYHLRRAMKSLDTEVGENDRIAFQMYGVEGRDAKETAKQLGMSVDAVYQAKSRIVRRLGQLIEQQIVEEG